MDLPSPGGKGVGRRRVSLAGRSRSARVRQELIRLLRLIDSLFLSCDRPRGTRSVAWGAV